MDKTAAGVMILPGMFNEKIIKMYLSSTIPNITQIIILSNTDFLVYRGRKGWSSTGTSCDAPNIAGGTVSD